jgi:hypothetical protein
MYSAVIDLSLSRNMPSALRDKFSDASANSEQYDVVAVLYCHVLPKEDTGDCSSLFAMACLVTSFANSSVGVLCKNNTKGVG